MLKTDLAALVQRVRELLRYNRRTGVFTWRVTRNQHARAGDVAGYIRTDEYRGIMIDGRSHYAHRLVWLYVYGAWPPFEIDHRNGLKDDNRLVNLIESTRSFNCQNERRPRKNGTSGFLGVSWDKNRSRWSAQIHADGVKRKLGRFGSVEEAHAAYVQAKRKLHPGGTL